MTLDDLTTIDQLKDFQSVPRRWLLRFREIRMPVTAGFNGSWADSAICTAPARIKVEALLAGITDRHLHCTREDKGVVIRYLMKISDYSRQQITRLIAQYRNTGQLKRRQRTVAGFASRYTAEDIRLLAAMDEHHDTPCGPAIKKLCERACNLFGQQEYERLASISVSHIYNLRKSTTYTRLHRQVEKTRLKVSSIGERRKPQPDGKAGYIRIDTVHQGDQDKHKGA